MKFLWPKLYSIFNMGPSKKLTAEDVYFVQNKEGLVKRLKLFEVANEKC